MGLEIATLLTIAAVSSTAGAAYGAYASYETGRAGKVAAERQAQAEREAADAEAAQIRDRAERLKASQIASLAGSGVKITGDGTEGALLSETDRLAEQDALAALTSGRNRANTLLAQGNAAYRSGINGMVSNTLNAVGNAAQGFAKVDAANAASRKAGQVDAATATIKRKSILGDT